MTPTILFVDDEPGNRLVFKEEFGDRFAVVTADSGEAALAELAKDHEIGIVVADQRMPKMTGNELLGKVREQDPAIIRIVATAFADLDPVLEAVNRGLVARYVIKPWRRSEIEEMLQWATQAYRLGTVDQTLQIRVTRIERLATIGMVAASVAHDLATPIAAVALNAARLVGLATSSETLARLVAESRSLADAHRENLADLAAEFPEIAHDLQVSSTHAHAVLQGISQLAKPSEQHETDDHDVVAAVDLATAMCHSFVERAGGRLEVAHPGPLPPTTLDSRSLTQVLINLVMNAAQALELLKEPSNESRVQVRAHSNSGGVEVVVDDNGPGMPQHLLDAADRFLFSTRTDGTGIGLPQCRRLVEGAGGVLELQSELGRGTSVRVWLPLQEVTGGSAQG